MKKLSPVLTIILFGCGLAQSPISDNTKPNIPTEKPLAKYQECMGGCTYSYISNKQAPCIKEKFYIKELLDYVYKYMKVNNITEYKYLSERQKNV